MSLMPHCVVRSKSALKLELQKRSEPTGQILARLSPVLLDFICPGTLAFARGAPAAARKQPFRGETGGTGGV